MAKVSTEFLILLRVTVVNIQRKKLYIESI